MPERNPLYDAIILHPNDNVATALRPLTKGETVRATGGESRLEIAVTEEIPLCHKIAVQEIRAGEVVRKYGEAIGQVTTDVPPGAWVHVHNLMTQRGRNSPTDAT